MSSAHHDTELLASELAPGQRRLVDTPRGRFVIARIDGEQTPGTREPAGAPGGDLGLIAFGAWCPHLDGPLWEGSIRDGEVGCPWHGWRYSLATGRCTWAPSGDIEEAHETELGRARCVQNERGTLRLEFIASEAPPG